MLKIIKWSDDVEQQNNFHRILYDETKSAILKLDKPWVVDGSTRVEVKRSDDVTCVAV